MLIRSFLALLILSLAGHWSTCVGQERLPNAELAPMPLVEKKQVTTADFLRVKRQVDHLVKKHGSDQVLLVVDIDNTLLALNQDLGSDQWFNWQEGLLGSNPDSNELVAETFEELLHVQGTLFALSGMHPPEPKLPVILKQIQDTGVTSVVLTSRGPEFRDSAERELERNGYDFSKPSLKVKEQRGRFKPYDSARPNDHGLSIETIAELGTNPRDVTYSSGIYMTAGQHKGYMLKTLLARTVRHSRTNRIGPLFKAIVFVDDHPKHVLRMQEAFKTDPIDLVTFRYSREDGNVTNFQQSSKQHAVHDWNRLEAFIGRVLVR